MFCEFVQKLVISPRIGISTGPAPTAMTRMPRSLNKGLCAALWVHKSSASLETGYHSASAMPISAAMAAVSGMPVMAMRALVRSGLARQMKPA